MKNLLTLKNIRKTYPGVIALNDVSFDVREGEVHALIGENGAGKSTLIKVITGAISPDSGTIEFEGKRYENMTPIISSKAGIEAIYQEFNLAPSLTVAENIFLGKKINSGITVDYKKLYQEAKKVLDNFHVELDPRKPVKDLSVAYMQLVEIAKAIARDAKLLIMDEPTAPLTGDEVENLFELITQLKKRGVSIIYISHRLDELFRISDRVTVMRDGEVVTTKNTEELTKDELIYYMVGRKMTETYPVRNLNYGEILLEVKDIVGNGIGPISFSLRRGEVLGIAGLVGAGRTELVRLIFGADKKSGGTVWLNGKELHIKSPRDAVKEGIGLVCEDRKNQGVLLRLPIKTNITISILERLSRFFVISKNKEEACVDQFKDALSIKTPSVEQLVANLSGGNQQKVALSKWLASESKILIFDEPTRGIDVGAKQEIYHLINRLVDEGIGIIMISSEMEEIMGMTDRMLILSEGTVTGELSKESYSQTTILKYASNAM